MTELTKQDRQALTEFLGECWHEWSENHYSANGVLIGAYYLYCKHCGRSMHTVSGTDTWIDDGECQRTFATWDDFGAVWKKASKHDWWTEFCDSLSFADRHFKDIGADYPARFNKLVAEWIRREK